MQKRDHKRGRTERPQARRYFDIGTDRSEGRSKRRAIVNSPQDALIQTALRVLRRADGGRPADYLVSDVLVPSVDGHPSVVYVQQRHSFSARLRRVPLFFTWRTTASDSSLMADTG